MSGKKQRRQIEVLQDTTKGMINEVVEAQKALDQLYEQFEGKGMKMEEAQQKQEAKSVEMTKNFRYMYFSY